MFKEHLKKLVDNVDGSVGALIMGLDGIAIDRYVLEGHNLDIDTIGMEFSFILTQVKKAGDILKLGGVSEFSIKSESITIVMRMLTDEYFLAVVLRADGNYGKRAKIERSDEIGELARAFNHMSARLAVNQREIAEQTCD